MRSLDFRSDTVTQPGPAMRRAMAEAVVGDDVLGDDPTVKELEERFAKMVGKEAALFLPSGTMGNLIAVLGHTRPGDELIMEERTHTFFYEGAGASRFGGVSIRTYPRASGIPEPEDLLRCLRNPDDVHQPRSRLFVLENTHNMAGGRIVPLERVRELAALCREQDLLMHIDGARLFHAATATGHTLSDWVAEADSVQCCLSKGLGAPVGSMLAGSEGFVREARRSRKALGGGMRQAGILAAAGLMALEEGAGRLQEDHDKAKRLAEGLNALSGVSVDLAATETNIVMADIEDDGARTWRERAWELGVLCFDVDPRRVRFVTHLDVGFDEVEEALSRLS